MTGGESSRRVSPRKRMLSLFCKQGIKISESYVKAQRQRGAKKPLFCPFFDCLRDFQETGNLKTHLRIHVRLLLYESAFKATDLTDFLCRLEKDRFHATSRAAVRNLLPRDIWRLTSWFTPVNNRSNVKSVARAIQELVGSKFTSVHM